MEKVVWLSFLAGMATLAGALLVLVSEGLVRVQKALAGLLGFAAGVMIGVVTLDLLPVAMAYGNVTQVVAGIATGILVMYMLDLLAAGPWAESRQYGSLAVLGYLVAGSIALHDLPEGLAIGVGYVAQRSLGWTIALAVAIHNIPEGMAIAAPLRAEKVDAWTVLLLVSSIALVTPLGAIIGWLMADLTRQLIGLLMALAAGAMIYVIRFELVPSSRNLNSGFASWGLFWGIVAALLLERG
ncbi:MAG: ZIP family metal transporter [Clostridia bacterium]|nr:ZIP family metal transporter [Clostridia bacterium]